MPKIDTRCRCSFTSCYRREEHATASPELVQCNIPVRHIGLIFAKFEVINNNSTTHLIEIVSRTMHIRGVKLMQCR